VSLLIRDMPGVTRWFPAIGAVTVAVLAATAVARASLAPDSSSHRCKAGLRHAVISGRHQCLKAGQRCNRRFDAQYHRYGFHCHGGRLTLRVSDVFSRRVDVGGYRLAITCRGTGTPTVILESGFGTPGSAWQLVQPRIATTTRVCVYDRAGLGGSEPRRPPGPVPASRVVEDLHKLLAGAGIQPPYILGGWSFGAFFVRFYTKRYPDEVLGLVSVDGTPAGMPPGRPDIDLVEGGNEAFYMAAADAEVAASPGLGARPLVVLTRGRQEAPADQEALWLRLQKEVALLSTSSILVRANGSGHAIQEQAPGLTTEAFRQVIAAVRARTPLPACAATPLPRLTGTCLDPSSP
jgi:hypothetical protein